MRTCYRCPAPICEFVSNNIGIEMHPANNNRSNNSPQIITAPCDVRRIMDDDSIKKLVYSKSGEYMCNAVTWGASKGQEYDNVCVILNAKTAKHLKNKKLRELRRITLNKFYVACTRTRGNLYFIEDSKIADYRMCNCSSVVQQNIEHQLTLDLLFDAVVI